MHDPYTQKGSELTQKSKRKQLCRNSLSVLSSVDNFFLAASNGRGRRTESFLPLSSSHQALITLDL